MNMSSRSKGKIGAGRSIVNRNERKFLRGSLMFIQGEQSSEMFIIKSGKVRILKQEGENSIELAVLGSGSVLGELSLLDHQPRGATAQVIEDVAVSVVDEKMLNATLKSIPSWLANIINVVVGRLRDTMARTARDLVEKSVSGTLRVISILYESEGYEVNGEKRLPVNVLKDAVRNVVGIGDVESEEVLLLLILKNMIFIRKDEMGSEYVVIRDLDAIKLYTNYLRAKQRGVSMLGENFSEETMETIRYIMLAGSKNGRRIKDNVFKIGLQQVGIEMARDNKSRHVSLDAIDELVDAKAIIRDQSATNSTHGVHKTEVIIYNEDILKRVSELKKWLPIFKEDVNF